MGSRGTGGGWKQGEADPVWWWDLANPHLSLRREVCWGRERGRRMRKWSHPTQEDCHPSKTDYSKKKGAPAGRGGEIPRILAVLGVSEFGSIPKRLVMTVKY